MVKLYSVAGASPSTVMLVAVPEDAPLVMEMPFDSSVIIKFTPPELSVAMQFKVTEKNDVETSDAVSPVGASVSVSVEEL